VEAQGLVLPLVLARWTVATGGPAADDIGAEGVVGDDSSAQAAGQPAVTGDRGIPVIDTTGVHPARVYDYWLGKDISAKRTTGADWVSSNSRRAPPPTWSVSLPNYRPKSPFTFSAASRSGPPADPAIAATPIMFVTAHRRAPRPTFSPCRMTWRDSLITSRCAVLA
jgi:hypothetical protein